MSQLTEKNQPEQFKETIIPLMKEYGMKLDAIRDHLQRIREEYTPDKKPQMDPKKDQFLRLELQTLKGLFQKLQPAAVNLAQHVSQQLEYGKLDDLTRLELRLRLAEFEHSLMSTQQFLSLNPF